MAFRILDDFAFTRAELDALSLKYGQVAREISGGFDIVNGLSPRRCLDMAHRFQQIIRRKVWSAAMENWANLIYNNREAAISTLTFLISSIHQEILDFYRTTEVIDG